MKKIIFTFCASLLFFSAVAQEIIGVSARYDDSYREWDIYDDSEAIIGEFVQRWQMNDNWKEWDLSFGDASGNIRQKWKNDPSRWELRLNGETITIKMRYPNDPNQWIITDDRVSIEYTTRFVNNPSEWHSVTDTYGKFDMVMVNEADPRDWEIFDNLKEDISPAMRLATIFITLMVSCPKE